MRIVRFIVSWSATHKHFLRRCRTGTSTRILTAIRGEVRTRSGRQRRPPAAVVDSSSVKASPVAGPRGFDDGAKKVNGIKHHILVDTSGVLVTAVVTPADVQDRAAFPRLLRIDTVSGPKPANGVTVQPRRRVVERHYEATREDVAAETRLVPEFVDDDRQFLMSFHTFVVEAETSVSSSTHALATRRTVR